MEQAVASTLSPSEGHRFTGHWREYRGAVTGGSVLEGLDFMHAREYDWRLGRFTAPDPAASSWNAYAYVSGNPVNFTDPQGLRPVIGEGWSDQPRNIAMAGSTETAFDWQFQSIPLSPSLAGVARSPGGYYLALVPQHGLVVLDENGETVSGEALPANVWEMVAVTIFRAPGVFPTMKEIFRKAGYGSDPTERGAIIYVGGDGKLWAVEVPWSAAYHQQTIGFTPSTVATAHTHPRRQAGNPSPRDMEEGGLSRLLMYVLHPTGVTVYVPKIGRTLRVLRRGWWG